MYVYCKHQLKNNKGSIVVKVRPELCRHILERHATKSECFVSKTVSPEEEKYRFILWHQLCNKGSQTTKMAFKILHILGVLPPKACCECQDSFVDKLPQLPQNGFKKKKRRRKRLVTSQYHWTPLVILMALPQQNHFPKKRLKKPLLTHFPRRWPYFNLLLWKQNWQSPLSWGLLKAVNKMGGVSSFPFQMLNSSALYPITLVFITPTSSSTYFHELANMF